MPGCVPVNSRKNAAADAKTPHVMNFPNLSHINSPNVMPASSFHPETVLICTYHIPCLLLCLDRFKISYIVLSASDYETALTSALPGKEQAEASSAGTCPVFYISLRKQIMRLASSNPMDIWNLRLLSLSSSQSLANSVHRFSFAHFSHSRSRAFANPL